MITKFLNTYGMISITRLPLNVTMTKKSFIEIVLGDIENKMKEKRPKFMIKWLYLHLDNQVLITSIMKSLLFDSHY